MKPPKDCPSSDQVGDLEVLAQQLGVAHDRVGPEAGEVLRLLGRSRLAQGHGSGDRTLGQCGVGAHGGGAAGAALVEHHHAVLAQGAGEPAG